MPSAAARNQGWESLPGISGHSDNTGERVDVNLPDSSPSASWVSWKKLNLTRWIPPVQSNIACTQHGSSMYIFGGISICGVGVAAASPQSNSHSSSSPSASSPPPRRRSNVLAKLDLTQPAKGWERLRPKAKTAKARVQPPSRSSAAIFVCNGKLWMFGGEGEFLDTERDGEGKDEGVEQDQSQDLNKERDVFNGLYCCDLATNQWTLHATSVSGSTLSPPGGRRGHSFLAISDTKAIMYGGVGPDKIFMQDCVCEDDLYLLDTSTLTWSEHSAAAAGREAANTQQRPNSNKTRSKRRSPLRASRHGRRYRSVSRSPSNSPTRSRGRSRVQVNGSSVSPQQSRRREEMLQELVTMSKTPRAVFPEPRTGHTLTFIPDQNAAWLVGGLSPKMTATLKGLRMKPTAAFVPSKGNATNERQLAPPRPKVAFASSDVWRLDTTTLSWKCAVIDGRGVGKVFGHSAVRSTSVPGTIFVVGGKREQPNQAGPPQATVFLLDTVEQRWSQAVLRGNAPAPRFHHCCAEIARGEASVAASSVAAKESGLLVFGGTCFRKYSGNTIFMGKVSIASEAEIQNDDDQCTSGSAIDQSSLSTWTSRPSRAGVGVPIVTSSPVLPKQRWKRELQKHPWVRPFTPGSHTDRWSSTKGALLSTGGSRPGSPLHAGQQDSVIQARQWLERGTAIGSRPATSSGTS